MSNKCECKDQISNVEEDEMRKSVGFEKEIEEDTETSTNKYDADSFNDHFKEVKEIVDKNTDLAREIVDKNTSLARQIVKELELERLKKMDEATSTNP